MAKYLVICLLIVVVLLPVVLLKSGPSTGRVAVIAEIIDHNRVSDGGAVD